MDFNYLFTSFEGRINRKPYWLGAVVMIAVSVAIVLVLSFVGFSVESRAFAIIGFVVQLLLLYPSAALMVKRLHDRNKPGYFAAFLLVPLLLQALANILGLTGDPLNASSLDYVLSGVILVVGLWFFVELGCLRGTLGDNAFGPDPLAGQT